MANISKQRREELISKINKIKESIFSLEDDVNKQTLIQYLSDLESEIKGKKYGLVYEEHKELIDEILETNTPVLSEDESLFIDNGGTMNFLIEGDNLASLNILEKTHQGKIDVIYIDPPYNTGHGDFIYNDNCIDDNDLFRHSKWLSFMKNRLKKAHRLLSRNGVIFISIDDNEQANIKMLCDEIFGENNNLGIFIVKSTPNARDYGYVGKMHEYMLFYAKDSKFVSTNLMPVIDKKFKYKDEKGGFNIHPLYNSNEAFTNLNRPNLYYPFYLDPKSKKGDFYSIYLSKEGEDWIEIYPPKSVKNNVQFVWRWGKEKALNNLNIEIVGYCLNGTEYRVVQKMRHDEKLIRSILDSTEYTSRKGTAEVEEILGSKIFSFPKPLTLIKDILYMATTKDSVILDFFAGSGTTGHAVMKLNKEDKGTRRFILCTNNENNICHDVTYERIKRVIEKENYQSSLKYMKVEFVPITEQFYYEYTDQLLLHIRELVELENGINFKGNSEIAIILTDEELEEFINGINDKCKTIYLGHDVLPTGEQLDVINSRKIKINIIPDYYYGELGA